MDTIIQNWDTYFQYLTAVIAIASIIVKLTPTQTDNIVLEKVIKIAEMLGLNAEPVNGDKTHK